MEPETAYIYNIAVDISQGVFYQLYDETEFAERHYERALAAIDDYKQVVLSEEITSDDVRTIQYLRKWESNLEDMIDYLE